VPWRSWAADGEERAWRCWSKRGHVSRVVCGDRGAAAVRAERRARSRAGTERATAASRLAVRPASAEGAAPRTTLVTRRTAQRWPVAAPAARNQPRVAGRYDAPRACSGWREKNASSYAQRESEEQASSDSTLARSSAAATLRLWPCSLYRRAWWLPGVRPALDAATEFLDIVRLCLRSSSPSAAASDHLGDDKRWLKKAGLANTFRFVYDTIRATAKSYVYVTIQYAYAGPPNRIDQQPHAAIRRAAHTARRCSARWPGVTPPAHGVHLAAVADGALVLEVEAALIAGVVASSARALLTIDYRRFRR